VDKRFFMGIKAFNKGDNVMVLDIINTENAIRREPEIKITHVAFYLIKSYFP
jgi:hypothetical protein